MPFTPATGPRFLNHLETDAATVRQALIQGAVTLVERLGVSSLHVNFPTEPEWSAMTEANLLPRQDIQFIWRNNGYRTFDDFLAALSANRRKTIKRERRDAQADLDIRVLTGADITEAHWDAFFAFYMDTGSRKWGQPYLTRDFFSRVGATMADRIALVMAFRDETPIAGALNFIAATPFTVVSGARWKTCPSCISSFATIRLSNSPFRVACPASKPGPRATTRSRGYLPSPVYSAHFIADPALRDPVARYLDGERPAVAAQMRAMTEELSPYKQV
ncbi:Uncharacterized protein conserved in bacteria [Brevundimonas vesicularis]|uniref:Uncharacterized protein conserved in bacteria n=1 Tax=Brevundimonas vesicularis TaxID=41276 RepID=A0A2X1BLN4_BREVE|nr:Uncharacterized protein conserved in bacteria [Brevundimonas vesicularis]